MNKNILLVIIFAVLLLIIPQAIRMLEGNASLPNSESYNTLRIYEQEHKTYDYLEDRSIMFNVLYFMGFSPSIIVARIIEIILAISALLLGYAILKKFNMSERNILAILLILSASPLFIETYSTIDFHALTATLGILTIYFLTREKTLIASVCFFIIPFIDVYAGIILFIMIWVYILSNKKNPKIRKTFLTIGMTALIISIVLNYTLGYEVLTLHLFDKSALLTEVGADMGFSFSTLVLALIGIILLWERGWRNFIMYGSVILFIILSVFNNFLRVYTNFVIAVFAGFAFIYLYTRKWSIQIIKKVTIVLIICSVMFGTLLYITQYVNKNPTPTHLDALAFLKRQSLPQEGVFSSIDNGHLIQYFAGLKTYADDRSIYRASMIDAIASSRNYDRTAQFLKENNIRYLFIDKDFRAYLDEKEGLSFLIGTTRAFQRIYRNDDIDIYMFVPEKVEKIK
jgi:hypothetical protein